MARSNEQPNGMGARAVSLATMANVARQVVIGGATYYRHNPKLYANPYFGSWGQIAFTPGEAQWPNDGAGAVAATIGAAVKLTPHRACLWLVDEGQNALPNGAAPSPSNCYILEAGQAIDLGGWDGDVLFAEDTNPALKAAGNDWTGGAVQALLGEAFVFGVDPLARYVGDGAAERNDH